MPTALPVWEQRFGRSGVDWSRSYGVFAEGELVAFLIHAIDEVVRQHTAAVKLTHEYESPAQPSIT